MPTLTDTRSFLPQLRRKTQQQLESTTSMDPYAVYGQTMGTTQPFGRAPGSGIEQNLGQQAMGLNFNVDAERAARQAQIERDTQQSRETLGRIFATDPGGVTSGTSENRFVPLEQERLRQMTGLESELSQRRGAETRANVSTLQGLQQGLNADQLAARNFGLNAMGQQLGFLEGQEQLGLQEGLATGYVGASPTLQREFGTAELTGRLGTQQTLGGRAQTETERAAREQERLAGRQVSVQEAAQSTDASIRQQAINLQDRIQSGELSIAQAQQVLNDFIQRGQLGLAGRQVDIQQQAQDLTDRIQSGQLTLAQAQQDLNRQVQLGQLSIEQADQILRQASTFGQVGGQMTEEKRQALEQAALQREQLYGGTAVRDQNGNVQVGPDGQPLMLDTLEGRRVANETAQQNFNQKITESGLTGTLNGQKTVQELQRGFDNQLREEELFGGKPPKVFNNNDITRAMNTRQGDPGFIPELDLNGDGQVGFNDWIGLQQSGRVNVIDAKNGVYTYTAPGKATVAAQELGVDEKRLKEQSRQFDASLKQTTDQFLADFTGTIFGRDPVTGDVTTLPGLDKQQLDEATRQFDERMEVTKEQFAKQMGIEEDKLSQAQMMAWLNLIGSLASSAGTVIAAGRTPRPGSTAQPTVPTTGSKINVNINDLFG